MTPIDITGVATLTLHVFGDPPPGIAPIDLECYMSMTYPNGGGSGVSSFGVWTRDFQILVTPGGYAPGGTGSWTVTCYPTVVYESPTATGSVEFLAY
jgi:hypothetical protein